MSILLTLMLLPIAAIMLASLLIWKWKGSERPIASGFAIFAIALVLALACSILLEGLGQLGLGFFVLFPAVVVPAVGMVFLLFGLVKGRRHAVMNLEKVTRIVLEDPHR